jgi:isopropylmalate/homocitrate/citramalate synthase
MLKKPRIHTESVHLNHIVHKLNTTREDIIVRAKFAVSMLNHVEDVEFYAEDAGRTDNDFLASHGRSTNQWSNSIRNTPDTTGIACQKNMVRKLSIGMKKCQVLKTLSYPAIVIMT